MRERNEARNSQLLQSISGGLGPDTKPARIGAKAHKCTQKLKKTYSSVLLHHHLRRRSQDHKEVQDASERPVGYRRSRLETHIWT